MNINTPFRLGVALLALSVCVGCSPEALKGVVGNLIASPQAPPTPIVTQSPTQKPSDLFPEPGGLDHCRPQEQECRKMPPIPPPTPQGPFAPALPGDLRATDVTPTGFTARWTENSNTSYGASISLGERTFQCTERTPGVCRVTGLEPNQKYKVTVSATTPGHMTVKGSIDVTTFPAVPVPPPTIGSCPSSGFKATWTCAPPPFPGDNGLVEKTTFNGLVFDDNNAPLDGVKIVARSLNATVMYQVQTTTVGGAYAFNNAPSGIQVAIIATKAGFTTRQRVEILKSNKQGDPNANKYDFGSADGTGILDNSLALSDKPEVIGATLPSLLSKQEPVPDKPGRNASGVEPKTSFELTFSEPMERRSVEDAFRVRVAKGRKLSIDSTTAPQTLTGNLVDVKEAGVFSNGDVVWDKNAFTISWNPEDTSITFAFKDERALPSDKTTENAPDYLVVFNGPDDLAPGVLRDKSGVQRQDDHFKLTDGPFEKAYMFAIKPDLLKPEVTGIFAGTTENASVHGDFIKVTYSKPMAFVLKGGKTLAGGFGRATASTVQTPAGFPSTSASFSSIVNPIPAAGNYTVTITPMSPTTSTGATRSPYVGTWQNLGGAAVYDTNDPTLKTVLLLPPLDLTTGQKKDMFMPGDTIKVQVLETVVDPAGNTVDTGRNHGTTNAT